MKHDISELLRNNPEPEESEAGLDVLLGDDELGVIKKILNERNIIDEIHKILLKLISDNLGYSIEGFSMEELQEVCVPAIKYIMEELDIDVLSMTVFMAAYGEDYEPSSTEMQRLQDDINFTKPEELFQGLYQLGLFEMFSTVKYKLQLIMYLTMQEYLNTREDFLTVFYRKIEMVEDPKSGFLEEVKQKFMEMVEDIFEFSLKDYFKKIVETC